MEQRGLSKRTKPSSDGSAAGVCSIFLASINFARWDSLLVTWCDADGMGVASGVGKTFGNPCVSLQNI